MRILLVKTSSMGDIVHTLYAIRQAKENKKELLIDWLVEESFIAIANIAKKTGDIETVIPVAFRRWRKEKPLTFFCHPEFKVLQKELREQRYDLVIDAQGLFKSAFLSRQAQSPIAGFDVTSAREGFASFFYQQKYTITKDQHAIVRLQKLFAEILQYQIPSEQHTEIVQNIEYAHKSEEDKKAIMLIHGTTWDNKCYPTKLWQQLAEKLVMSNYDVVVPQNSEREHTVAKSIANGNVAVNVLEKQPLSHLIEQLNQCAAVISVDTGLAHLAAFLNKPTILLFGPTNPKLTGGLGKHCANVTGLASDSASMKRVKARSAEDFSKSMQAILPDTILAELQRLLAMRYRE